MIKFYVKVW